MNMQTLQKLGDCRNESLVEELFGSVTDFARIAEEMGNNFVFRNFVVSYDMEKDIHSFYLL